MLLYLVLNIIIKPREVVILLNCRYILMYERHFLKLLLKSWMRLEAPSEGSFCGNIFEIIVLGKGSLKLPQYIMFSPAIALLFSILMSKMKVLLLWKKNIYIYIYYISKYIYIYICVCVCLWFLTSFFNKFLTITQQKSKEIQTHIHFMSFLFGEHDIQTGDGYYIDSNQ